jgi:hypothetical protein
MPRRAGLPRGFERVDGPLAVRVGTEVTVQIGRARQVDAHEKPLTRSRLLSRDAAPSRSRCRRPQDVLAAKVARREQVWRAMSKKGIARFPSHAETI